MIIVLSQDGSQMPLICSQQPIQMHRKGRPNLRILIWNNIEVDLIKKKGPWNTLDDNNNTLNTFQKILNGKILMSATSAKLKKAYH